MATFPKGEQPDHLFLALDGVLFNLPFAALPLDADVGNPAAPPRYVLDCDFTLSYLTAGRDLLRLRHYLQPPPAKPWCRIVANPKFAEANPKFAEAPPGEAPAGPVLRDEFKDLFNAELEGDMVRELWENSKMKVELLIGNAATKEVFLKPPTVPWLGAQLGCSSSCL